MTITPQAVLDDAFTRIHDNVHGVVAGLTEDQLSWRPDGHGNSIAWLVWHLTRIQDDHVAGAAGSEQVWMSEGWARRFALPFDVGSTGYGQGGDDVSAVNVDGDLLVGYHDAVHARTAGYLSEIDSGDLDRVVDDRWDPPVTLAVRLVSVVGDDFQHVGQAAYVSGLLR